MKWTSIIPLQLAPLLVSIAAAQLDNWNNVQRLPIETKIKVQLKSGRTFGHCFVAAVSDDTLTCDIRAGRRFGTWSRERVYPRDNVKAVFHVHNGPLIGAAVGAGTGAILGATKASCCRGANALIGAGLMAMPGIVIGTMADPFFHGRAIYRSANTPSPTQSNPTQPDLTDPPQPKIPCLRDGVTLKCVQ